MRDGRFASWENIVSRFQTSPPWKKLTHESESTQHSTEPIHCELKGGKSVSYLLFSWPYVCISLACSTFTDFGNHFGEYCGLTKIPKSDLWQKIPKPVKQFYHTSTVEVGNGTDRSTYQQQRHTMLHSFIRQKERKKGLTGLRIAEIYLDDLPETCKLEKVDLTTEENRYKYLGNAVCKNFAKASCEVLLKCNVPIPCHVVDPPEEKNVLERLFRAANFIPF